MRGITLPVDYSDDLSRFKLLPLGMSFVSSILSRPAAPPKFNDEQRTHFRHSRFIDVLLALLLAVLVLFIWCIHYHRWTAESLRIPVNYIGGRNLDVVFTGDGLWGMSFAKLMADGEIGFWEKSPKSLGAPFGANWNDWPSFEEGLNAWWSGLVRLAGVFAGSNLAFISGLIFAAVTMYAVCRYLQYDHGISFAVAALFGLSRYGFWRNLSNLTLTFYWHLPLGLLVAWWCIRERSLLRDRHKLLASAIVAVLFGIQNPYYSGILMQLIFWAAVFATLRWKDWRRAIAPIVIGTVLVLTTLLMNLDTLKAWSHHGANLDVATRSYFDVERYALKPVELFLPFSHSIRTLGRWTGEAYFHRTLVPTEQGSAYIGLVAALGLVWLVFRVAQSITRRDAATIPVHFWGFFLLAAFSVTSGLNGVVGLFGFRLFRCSNRYSIAIMAISLLFLAKTLTKLGHRWRPIARYSLACVVLVLGLCDQVPPYDKVLARERNKAWSEDEKLAQKLETKLPQDAMVFQLPVHDFPEAYLTVKMDDYEQFRPYLHSSGLRFSYGDTKGRYQPRWQREAEYLGPEGMLNLLEKYGFAALVINRDGYPDRGEAMAREIRALGKRYLAQTSNQWIAFRLNPARRPSLPPVFEQGWYTQEGTFGDTRRWSSGDAVVVLYNQLPTEKNTRLLFGLASDTPRVVELSLANEIVVRTNLDADQPHRTIDVTVSLKPGRNELHFQTDRPGSLPASGDQRVLAFALTNFRDIPAL